jgi:dolichol kinase
LINEEIKRATKDLRQKKPHEYLFLLFSFILFCSVLWFFELNETEIVLIEMSTT